MVLLATDSVPLGSPGLRNEKTLCDRNGDVQ